MQISPADRRTVAGNCRTADNAKTVHPARESLPLGAALKAYGAVPPSLDGLSYANLG